MDILSLVFPSSFGDYVNHLEYGAPLHTTLGDASSFTPTVGKRTFVYNNIPPTTIIKVTGPFHVFFLN